MKLIFYMNNIYWTANEMINSDHQCKPKWGTQEGYMRVWRNEVKGKLTLANMELITFILQHLDNYNLQKSLKLMRVGLLIKLCGLSVQGLNLKKVLRGEQAFLNFILCEISIYHWTHLNYLNRLSCKTHLKNYSFKKSS